MYYFIVPFWVTKQCNIWNVDTCPPNYPALHFRSASSWCLSFVVRNYSKRYYVMNIFNFDQHLIQALIVIGPVFARSSRDLPTCKLNRNLRQKTKLITLLWSANSYRITVIQFVYAGHDLILLICLTLHGTGMENSCKNSTTRWQQQTTLKCVFMSHYVEYCRKD